MADSPDMSQAVRGWARDGVATSEVQNGNALLYFWEGCQKRGGLENGKLAEASHCKGGHVVHMCHPVLTLSGGGVRPPADPPSTHLPIGANSGEHFLKLSVRV